MAEIRTLAQVYRRYGESQTAGTSPQHKKTAIAISESPAALAAIGTAPVNKRQPALILAALHALALAGSAPRLAAAYTTADDAAPAALEILTANAAAVVDIAARREFRDHPGGHCAVLYPAIAEAARRANASAIGLIDVGGWAGLNLNVDRVAITYRNGQRLGVGSSPVQMTASLARGGLPEAAMPTVAAKIVLDSDPLSVTNAEDCRWLRACQWPEPRAQSALLTAQIALAASDAPRLIAGEAIDVLPEALAHIPDQALPIILTTWALSRLSLADRLRFTHRLDAAGARRPLAWVSIEGVGVSPGIPTLGDRRASGHSIIGLAEFDHARMRAEALGRCWQRGQTLAWLDGSPLG